MRIQQQETVIFYTSSEQHLKESKYRPQAVLEPPCELNIPDILQSYKFEDLPLNI